MDWDGLLLLGVISVSGRVYNFRFLNPLPTQTAPLANLLLPKPALVVAVALATAEHHRSCYHWNLRNKWRNVARCWGKCNVSISGKHLGNNKKATRKQKKTNTHQQQTVQFMQFSKKHRSPSKKNCNILKLYYASNSSHHPRFIFFEKNSFPQLVRPQWSGTCAAFHHALWEATRRLRNFVVNFHLSLLVKEVGWMMRWCGRFFWENLIDYNKVVCNHQFIHIPNSFNVYIW